MMLSVVNTTSIRDLNDEKHKEAKHSGAADLSNKIQLRAPTLQTIIKLLFSNENTDQCNQSANDTSNAAVLCKFACPL